MTREKNVKKSLLMEAKMEKKDLRSTSLKEKNRIKVSLSAGTGRMACELSGVWILHLMRPADQRAQEGESRKLTPPTHSDAPGSVGPRWLV